MDQTTVYKREVIWLANWTLKKNQQKNTWNYRVFPKFCIFFYSVLFWIWCVLLTWWIVLNFESKIINIIMVSSFKVDQDLIAWRRDVARWNWKATIHSHHGWCTWTTIINVQWIIAEKLECWFVFLIWQLNT